MRETPLESSVSPMRGRVRGAPSDLPSEPLSIAHARAGEGIPCLDFQNLGGVSPMRGRVRGVA